jgi:hypothetical protein
MHKQNRVVLHKWRVLTADCALRPASPFHMNRRNRNVTGDQGLLVCDTALEASTAWCQRWRHYVHSKYREPPPQQHSITSQQAWTLNNNTAVKPQMFITNITAIRRTDVIHLVMFCSLPLFESMSNKFLLIWTQRPSSATHMWYIF